MRVPIIKAKVIRADVHSVPAARKVAALVEDEAPESSLAAFLSAFYGDE